VDGIARQDNSWPGLAPDISVHPTGRGVVGPPRRRHIPAASIWTGLGPASLSSARVARPLPGSAPGSPRLLPSTAPAWRPPPPPCSRPVPRAPGWWGPLGGPRLAGHDFFLSPAGRLFPPARLFPRLLPRVASRPPPPPPPTSPPPTPQKKKNKKKKKTTKKKRHSAVFRTGSSGKFDSKGNSQGWHFTKYNSRNLYGCPINRLESRSLLSPGDIASSFGRSVWALDPVGYRPECGEFRWPEHIGFHGTAYSTLPPTCTRCALITNINCEVAVQTASYTY